MKTDQILTRISRQLRPCLSKPITGIAQSRPASGLAAFHQIARSTRPLARSFRQRYHPGVVQVQHNSTAIGSLISTDAASPSTEPAVVPTYELTFTCKPCKHRSTHRVTHQGYNHGTVIIECPSCKNRHIMADHLKFFEDKSFTIEDLMREKKGQFKRGMLNGDMEFWSDGTKTERKRS